MSKETLVDTLSEALFELGLPEIFGALSTVCESRAEAIGKGGDYEAARDWDEAAGDCDILRVRWQQIRL